MPASARREYLTTQVMTATPQKLQLMLIEGAIRYGTQAKHLRSEQREDEACEALVRCQEIMGELLASVSAGESDVSRKLAGIYVYLFRTLTEANLQHDDAKLDDVLSVLAIERDTWSQVCEEFGSVAQNNTAAPSTSPHAPSASPPATPHAESPSPAALDISDNPPHTGISFQA